ncbi:MAG: hypothetical protein ABIO70_02180 [Pseudomonadota bacterium]
MTTQSPTPLPTLFKQWRGGDASAGQEMARRFSDWYYAITVSRLGEFEGREPLKRSCDRFAREIVTLNSASRLMDWAQGIIQEELDARGGRIQGGDFPNALTERRSPSELLASAWEDLSHDQLTLLAHAYDATYPLDKLTAEAEAAGGYPIAVLRARLELKRWLRDTRGVPLAVVPDEPDLDCAPMPIYESGRMLAGVEEARFERWMLSRFDLCRDVAEFAVFSLAIRAGALSVSAPARPPAPAPSAAFGVAGSAAPSTPAAERAPAPSGSSKLPLAIGIGVVVLLLLGVLGALAVLLLMR